jgi:sugar O-acyltransferase (sialic acid O-acetyltransferase NeuD family)
MAFSDRPLLILGTGTFAQEVADLASEVPGFKVVGFVENWELEKCQGTLSGLPILWVDKLAEFVATHWAVCGLGTTQRSRFTEQVAAYGIRFATIIHPKARISTTSSLDEGSVVSVGVIVAAHTQIGRHVILNRGALIGHHTKIGDFTTIGPGANIAGNCRIGTATYIGMGAVVLDHLTIGAHSVVGAGAVVTRDVPDHVQVMGVPARIITENIPGK